MKALVVEAVIVGVALSAALAALAAWTPQALRGAWRAAATGLVLGALFHLGFEASGLNAAYCVSGHACSKK